MAKADRTTVVAAGSVEGARSSGDAEGTKALRRMVAGDVEVHLVATFSGNHVVLGWNVPF